MFLKIGLFTVGGGYAMIPLIQSELVDIGWMSNAEVADLVAISQMTPGPFAVNAATFAGVKLAGIPGAVITTIGVAFPSFVIAMLAAKFFFAFNKNKTVQDAMYGIRPAVVGLIAAATYTLAVEAFGVSGGNFNMLFDMLLKNYIPLIIFAITLVGVIWLKRSPLLMIFVSAGLGIVAYLAGAF